MAMADELNLEHEEIGESIHGGGRFNHWLLASGVTIAMVVGVVLVYGLSGSGAVPQTATQTPMVPDDAASDRARVNELASYANTPTRPAPVVNLTPVAVIPKQTAAQATTPPASKQPTPFQAWEREEFLEAHKAGPLVKNFHDNSALEIAQAERNGSTGAAIPPGNTTVHPPASPYCVMAGSIIPAVLVNGINSDLPGPIIAQVSENVFDSATGKSLLIPQGSKLIGDYSNMVGYGQQRVEIAFARLIFPDTSSMDLPHSVGADEAGFSGVSDEVNNHYLQTFGTAAVMALISAGQAVGQIAAYSNQPATVGPLGYLETMSQEQLAVQQASSNATNQLGNVGAQVVSKGLNRAPTLTIRPGFQLNVLLTSDLVFAHPFQATNG
jgi:type IV secretory pathway VirB10-like protein